MKTLMKCYTLSRNLWISTIIVLLISVTTYSAYPISFTSYSPVTAKIDKVQPFGDLSVKEQYSSFLLEKDGNLILSIRKSGNLYGETKYPMGYSEMEIDLKTPSTVSLRSDNPNILLCYLSSGVTCKTEIAANASNVYINTRKLSDIANSLGVKEDEIKTTVDFTLNGQVDDQEFAVYGKLLIDTTPESRMAYEESIQRAIKAWEMLNEIGYVWIVLIPIGFVGLIVSGIMLAVKPRPSEQKRDVIWQMILAGIPTFGSSLYAFYRINKQNKGILLLLGVWSLVILIPLLYEYLYIYDILAEFPRPIILHVILPVILIPLYFVRKWTLEYNKWIDAFFPVKREPRNYLMS